MNRILTETIQITRTYTEHGAEYKDSVLALAHEMIRSAFDINDREPRTIRIGNLVVLPFFMYVTNLHFEEKGDTVVIRIDYMSGGPQTTLVPAQVEIDLHERIDFEKLKLDIEMLKTADRALPRRTVELGDRLLSNFRYLIAVEQIGFQSTKLVVQYMEEVNL